MTTDDLQSKDRKQMVEQLKKSKIYQDYESAFRNLTGLPINLRAAGAFDLPHRGDPNENPFCVIMAKSNQSCAACLQLQRRVEDQAGIEPKTLKCFAGLCDSAVPIRVGENLVAFLQTGQILLHRPTAKQFAETTRNLLKWGTEVDLKRLEEAYFQTRVLSKKQYDAVLNLLNIFAKHLAQISNQLAIQKENIENPSIQRAKVFIADQYAEELSLSTVAKQVNMSAFYFCKMFKQATSLNFTDYLARIRVEKVKHLLLNPNMRISEAAFAVGFQSLSQFNRTFRRIECESPTVFRDKLHQLKTA